MQKSVALINVDVFVVLTEWFSDSKRGCLGNQQSYYQRPKGTGWLLLLTLENTGFLIFKNFWCIRSVACLLRTSGYCWWCSGVMVGFFLAMHSESSGFESGPSLCKATLGKLFTPISLRGKQRETASLSHLQVTGASWTHLGAEDIIIIIIITATRHVVWFSFVSYVYFLYFIREIIACEFIRFDSILPLYWYRISILSFDDLLSGTL